MNRRLRACRNGSSEFPHCLEGLRALRSRIDEAGFGAASSNLAGKLYSVTHMAIGHRSGRRVNQRGGLGLMTLI